MLTNDNNLPFYFNNQQECDFLLDALQPEHVVLEWGSGLSTITMAKRVSWVYSIEHDKNYIEKVHAERVVQGINNICLVHVPKNKEEPQGHDGDLSHFLDYVQYPLRFEMKFDVILVDGRARIHCAEIAAGLLKPGGVIFIHDYKHPEEKYRRRQYEVVETFLEEIAGVFALYKFRNKL